MTDRLIAIVLDDDGGQPLPSPQMEQERRLAILDLLEANHFALPPREGRGPGPYRLALSLRDRRLVFALTSEGGDPMGEFHLSLGPFRQVVKDYDKIRESYEDAVREASPSRIETIDMARRGIHDEGARVLRERLDGKADLDRDTARRLFTLICVLYPDG